VPGELDVPGHPQCLDRREAQHAQQAPEPLEAGLEIAGENGEHTIGVRSTLAKVRLEMARLPAEQRAVLMLVCVEGMSYQEAAGVLTIPIGTLMSRLARARLALADRMRHDQSGEGPKLVEKIG
jgi:RNA polymerase sigma-70 factor, ECF subfamily